MVLLSTVSDSNYSILSNEYHISGKIRFREGNLIRLQMSYLHILMYSKQSYG